jgi:hypothetical protein
VNQDTSVYIGGNQVILLHVKYEGIYTTERENNGIVRVLHFSFAVDGFAKPCKLPHTENNHHTT